MNDFGSYAFSFLLWPGLLSAILLGWLDMWIARKLVARWQGRKGPPFYQPFFDFVKLLAKRTAVPTNVNPILFYLLPLASLVSVSVALVLVPMPGNPSKSFQGDVIFLLYLLEVPVLCDILAGYVSRSLYGEVSSMREALMTIAYNLPFLAGVIALAVHAKSFNMASLSSAPLGYVHIFAAIAFLVAIPARLKSNPFSIPNAEQEIVAGAHIEYNGAPLAFFELSHSLELVVLVDLFVILFVPQTLAVGLMIPIDIAIGVGLVALISFIAATTARLKLNQAFKFYWTWGALAALAAVVAAVI
jgi:NADH-quinone oxidoreductase subunit H